MKKVVVVGSGAGGAVAAKELQGKAEVTVLEAGREFRPFSVNLSMLETAKATGLFFDARMIRLLFPCMQVRKTDDMVLVNGIGTGGTTTLSAGNAVRADAGLREIGLDLDVEFAELYREIPVTTAHAMHWRETTKQLFSICGDMDLHPHPTPKMGRYERCTNCGRCVLGCPYGVKWDSRAFVREARSRGARLVTGCRVVNLEMEGGKVRGVWAREALARRFYPADMVILAAGGLGTPVILQNSGISCEPRLFVDPVLCLAAPRDACLQNREVSMPFIVQREHFILSPYFDYLSFFFHRPWSFPARNTLGLMVKLADSASGRIDSKGISKTLTPRDMKNLEDGMDLCRQIFRRLGVREKDMVPGALNAGHPGGMLPLTEREAETIHDDRLPPNLFVADATLLPRSLGNPPIFTIMALAKRVSRVCLEHL